MWSLLLLLIEFAQFSFLDDRPVQGDVDDDVRILFDVLLSLSEKNCCFLARFTFLEICTQSSSRSLDFSQANERHAAKCLAAITCRETLFSSRSSKDRFRRFFCLSFLFGDSDRDCEVLFFVVFRFSAIEDQQGNPDCGDPYLFRRRIRGACRSLLVDGDLRVLLRLNQRSTIEELLSDFHRVVDGVARPFGLNEKSGHHIDRIASTKEFTFDLYSVSLNGTIL